MFSFPSPPFLIIFYHNPSCFETFFLKKAVFCRLFCCQHFANIVVIFIENYRMIANVIKSWQRLKILKSKRKLRSGIFALHETKSFRPGLFFLEAAKAGI